METIERQIKGFFNSAGLKLALIAFLTLLLLIPATMIMGLIREREQRRDETIGAVTALWGNAQTICGPILTVPYETIEKTGDAYNTVIRYAHFLPENLKIEGSVEPEVRYRGIYQVVTYTAKLHVTGNFSVAGPGNLQIKPEQFQGDKAIVEIGITDMRGINQDIQLHFGDSVFSVIPGLPSKEISVAGIHYDVPQSFATKERFEYDLDLNGSHSLSFIPVGKETSIKLISTWNAPSFSGAFLPDERSITKKGFTAKWNILQLNRNFPQQWTGDQYTMGESVFGVDLITPLDTYQKSMRSVKYAVLFISLTFLVLFFSEILTKIRIHPVNYLLTGFAICVFYSLLTALAEHLSFAPAYLASSFTIITMVTFFTHSLYHNRKVTLTIISSLVVLYAFLFVVLQLVDYSLLFGNIGLVIILALVMYFSRKIDWYATVGNSIGKEETVSKND
jgi:inner membrane protein